MTKLIPFTLLVLIFPLHAANPVWKIDSASTSLYLAGTVHILRDSDYPLPPAFDQAYAESTKLVFEVDIEETQSVSFRRAMAQAVRLPAGTRLGDVLAPETLELLQAYLQQKGLQVAQFEDMKPAVIATTLSMMELQNIGVSGQGVDAYFYQRARQDRKPVAALETAQQQIDYLTQMGKGNEDMMIVQTLKEIESLKTDFSDMLHSWREGNTERLKALFIDPMQQDFAPVYRQLLVERNMLWMQRLNDYLDTQETELVLVGAAHLVGSEGLLKLLADKGYRITQLP